MSIDWDIFDKIIYINLKERSDRRKSIENELKSLGIPANKIYRLEAKRHLVGQIGCAQSHLQALETAVDQNWGHIMIVEDDMVFNNDSAAQEHLNDFLKILKTVSWNAALLSANYRKVIPLKSTDKVVKPLDALCACAYAVHADYRAILHGCFSDAIKRLLKGGWKYDHAIDIAWLPLMQTHTWLGMFPVAGHQAPGKSDIEDGVMDYTEYFYKKIADIAV